MKTNSNLNPLKIVIISAVVLFVFALIWKNSNTDNSETVIVEQTPTVPKTKPIKRIDTSKEVTFTSETKQADSELSLPELKKTYKENVESDMKMALTYNTPEKLLKAITFYQSKGEDLEADKLIEYLLEHYPDFDSK